MQALVVGGGPAGATAARALATAGVTVRLLDYVRNGGRLIVQYNKFEFNEAQYGPHAAKVTSDRVTDETSAVRILEQADPLLPGVHDLIERMLNLQPVARQNR